ncbi:MAG: hypothetical protein ACRDKT_05545 [Actinomycetota bacterium]
MIDNEDPIMEVLRRAQAAVDDAGVANDLRPRAFTAAISLLVGDGPVAVLRQGLPLSGLPGAAVGEDSVFAKLATALRVDEAALPYIFEEEAGDLRLVIPRHLLPNPGSRAAAMRDVAQMIMAGRQLGGIADWTPYERLRSEIAELGVLDSANFASEIQTLDVRLQGGRRSREARLTRHGLDEAAALVRRVIEGIER